jgi:hypothetical protein
MLFMMSRRARDVGAPASSPVAVATQQTRRARLRPEKRRAQPRAAANSASSEAKASSEQDGPITREEMTRLFGNALRVR